MNQFWLILLSVCLGSFGQITLKIGANKIGQFNLAKETVLSDAAHILKTPEILMGLILFGASFLLWIKVLTRSELSLAYPMASLGYINVVAVSSWLFGESITQNKIVGILFIMIGIVILHKQG